MKRDSPARQQDRLLAWLALPWLVLPPAILVIASQFTPVYQFMYVEFCLPAVALLAGAGIAALGWPLRRAERGRSLRWAVLREPLRRGAPGWPVRWAALGLVVALGIPAQLAIRAPSGGGSLRGAAQILARYERPGDAVFYPGSSVPTWDIAYPAGFGGLRDIGLGETAVAASRLAGVPASPGVIQQRLRGVRRLWVIEMGNAWKPAGITLPPALRLSAAYGSGSIRMRLYVRAGQQPVSRAAR